MKSNTTNASFIPMVTLPELGTYRLEFNHRSLKLLEDLLGRPIGAMEMNSIREMDCCLYCGIYADAAVRGTVPTREAFEQALDRMRNADYLRAAMAAARCFNESFDAPELEDEEEPGEEPEAKNEPEAATGMKPW